MHKMTLTLSFRFLALGVLTGALWFYVAHGFSRVEELRVVVTQQPDSPLLINITFVDPSTNPLSPRYGYSITNRSSRPVRAFTIRESVYLDAGAPVSGTTMSHMAAVKLFLMPGETRQAEGGIGSTYHSPPIKVELAVDFVELADGTRWGDDKGGSGERLDGIRAGGKAAIKMYREILSGRGLSALEQALAKSDLIQPEGSPMSDRWLDAFNMGVSTVKSRLAKAKTKNGPDELKRELAKPFDSTEGRQEP